MVISLENYLYRKIEVGRLVMVKKGLSIFNLII